MFAQVNDTCYLVHPSQSQSWWGENGESKRKVWNQMPSETWNMEWGSSMAYSKNYAQGYQYKTYQWSSANASAPYNGAAMQGCDSDGMQRSAPMKQEPSGNTPSSAGLCVPCGELPSIGSAGHADGTCKRCAFFSKGRCKNGKDCDHCHFDHPNRKRNRRQQAYDRCVDDVKDTEVDDTTLKLDITEKQCESTNASEQGEEAESEEVLSEFPESSNEQEEHDDEEEAEPEEENFEDEQPEKPVLTAEEAAQRIKELEAALAAARVEYELQLKDEATRASELSSSCSSTSLGVASDSDTCDAPQEHRSKQSGELSPSSSVGSPTSWAAQARARRLAREQGASAGLSAAEVGRKTRCLLNKLTEERFESICSQLIALPMSTPDHLRAVVAEVFEKATTEQGFLALYTEMCLRLDQHLASKEDELVGGKAFRRAIITECQAYFERTFQQPIQVELAEDLDETEIFEQQMKLKNKCLGNMRFIGKLLVEKLLAGKILMPVMTDMLDVGTDASLESLAVLLSVVGPHFEQKPLFSAHFKATFAKLQHASKDASLPLRVRCLLCDLLEERARGWIPRGAASPKSARK